MIPIDMIDMISKEATISLGGDGEREKNLCIDTYFKLCVKIYYDVDKNSHTILDF